MKKNLLPNVQPAARSSGVVGVLPSCSYYGSPAQSLTPRCRSCWCRCRGPRGPTRGLGWCLVISISSLKSKKMLVYSTKKKKNEKNIHLGPKQLI
jgi:hypothetical protein